MYVYVVVECGWWIYDYSVVVLKFVEYLGFFCVVLFDLNGLLDSFFIVDDECVLVVGIVE